jgi:hypothetical protein
MDKFRYNYSLDGFNALLGEYKRSLNQELQKILLDCEEALAVLRNYSLPKLTAFTLDIINAIKEVLCGQDVYVVKKYENFSFRLDVERKLDETILEYKDIVANARDMFKSLCKKVDTVEAVQSFPSSSLTTSATVICFSAFQSIRIIAYSESVIVCFTFDILLSSLCYIRLILV